MSNVIVFVARIMLVLIVAATVYAGGPADDAATNVATAEVEMLR